MNLYVLEEVERCTDNQHDGGGLVIIAKSRLYAQQMIEKINQDRDINDQSPLYVITPEQWEAALEFVLAGPAEAQIIVFPNAGCC